MKLLTKRKNESKHWGGNGWPPGVPPACPANTIHVVSKSGNNSWGKKNINKNLIQKGFNWKLSSGLKKVGKSEDAWSPLFPLHGSFPWQSGGPGDRERPTWKATTPTPSPQYPSQNAPTPNPISHILFPALHRLYCNVSEGHHKLPQYRDICVYMFSSDLLSDSGVQ